MGLREAQGNAPMELRARVATSVVRGVIVWWLCPPEGSEPVSIETVSAWLWDLVSPLWFVDAAAGGVVTDARG